MSHFNVAVIGENVAWELEPFQENNCGTCPEEFLEFIELDDLAWYEKDFEKNTDYSDFHSFMTEYHGYKFENSKYGYIENPNRKWDWYEVGGRWSNSILTKNGQWTDSCKIKDIDFEGMKNTRIENAVRAWTEIEKILQNGETDSFELRFNYGYQEGITKEEYVKQRAYSLSSYCFLKDRTWYEKGEMGWFGIGMNEKDTSDWQEELEDLILNLDPEETLTIVDCHI